MKAMTTGHKMKTFLRWKGGIWYQSGGNDEEAMGKSCRPRLHKLLIKTRAGVGELGSNSSTVINWLLGARKTTSPPRFIYEKNGLTGKCKVSSSLKILLF